MQVRFSETAERDLEGIWNYIFQESESEDALVRCCDASWKVSRF